MPADTDADAAECVLPGTLAHLECDADAGASHDQTPAGARAEDGRGAESGVGVSDDQAPAGLRAGTEVTAGAKADEYSKKKSSDDIVRRIYDGDVVARAIYRWVATRPNSIGFYQAMAVLVREILSMCLTELGFFFMFH